MTARAKPEQQFSKENSVDWTVSRGRCNRCGDLEDLDGNRLCAWCAWRKSKEEKRI